MEIWYNKVYRPYVANYEGESGLLLDSDDYQFIKMNVQIHLHSIYVIIYFFTSLVSLKLSSRQLLLEFQPLKCLVSYCKGNRSQPVLA